MPHASASDGVQLHWEERGSGPAVILVAYWSLAPSVWSPITAELERDHRVIRYDDRGTGRSERVGPYDQDTCASDLEAVIEAADAAPAIAICVMDGSNRAVRVAERRPDLISHVVAPGGMPLSRRAISGTDAMVGSNVVVGAFMKQLETDYRGAVRGIMEAANPQMTQDELRARVSDQVEHVPLEVASERIREWAEDEAAAECARELGDRMVVLLSPRVTGGWFPEPHVMERMLAEYFPEAVLEEIEDGMISRPDCTAAVVRRLTAARALNVESQS